MTYIGCGATRVVLTLVDICEALRPLPPARAIHAAIGDVTDFGAISTVALQRAILSIEAYSALYQKDIVIICNANNTLYVCVYVVCVMYVAKLLSKLQLQQIFDAMLVKDRERWSLDLTSSTMFVKLDIKFVYSFEHRCWIM